uniref:Uncharacterized protein n=1 Tax=Callorhinchus milii TaxID=7868 RepID=A0A4W3JTB3_CALMI
QTPTQTCRISPPNFQCFYDGCFTVPCGSCETCVLSAKLDITAQWFPRAGELSKRRFLSGIVRRFHSLDLLQQISRVLQPTTSKDYTYSRSRIIPSLTEDMSNQSSDRALDRDFLRKTMMETWEWFVLSKYWTKVNYSLGLLHMCDSELLHVTGNLIRLLILRKQTMVMCETTVAHMKSTLLHSEIKRQKDDLMSWKKEMKFCDDPSQNSENPALMIVATSFKSTSGVSKNKDFIRCLPVHLSKYILGMLDLTSQKNCLSVSRHWNCLTTEIEKDMQTQLFILQESQTMKVSFSVSLVPEYCLYYSKAFLFMRIMCELLQQTLALIPMYNGFRTEIIQMEERNVFLQIAINALTPKLQAKELPLVIQGHTAGIKALIICEKRGFVISGSYDLSIRQWNLKNGNCLNVFRGHIGTVTCLALHENKMVSGGKDCQVKVWNLLTGKTICNFMHSKHILAVKISEQFVVSSCEQGIVKVWNVSPPSVIKILEGHHGPVTCLSFDQWHLVSGSKDTYIMAWSMVGKYKHCLMVFKHPKEVLCLEFTYMRVISGCKDGNIRIFDLCNANCLRVLRANSNMDAVLSLNIAENRSVYRYYCIPTLIQRSLHCIVYSVKSFETSQRCDKSLSQMQGLLFINPNHKILKPL